MKSVKNVIHKIIKGVPGSLWWSLVTQLQVFGALPLTEYFPFQVHQLISKNKTK